MEQLKNYVEKFNRGDEEFCKNKIDNAHAYEWLAEEIPLLECPDKMMEETYYFRWWTYRKHVRETEDGILITEFLPKVPWSGKHNEINAAVGHHLYEGRWLKNSGKYLKSYIHYFLDHPKRGHQYSAWMLYAVYQMCRVTGDWDLGEDFLDKAMEYYAVWERTHLLENGMFWSIDDHDAMEDTISGTTEDLRALKGIRPTLNCYMSADAWAIAQFALREGKAAVAEEYLAKAERLKKAVNEVLWQDGFYRAFHFEDEDMGMTPEQMVDNWKHRTPKELIGYLPWMFEIPAAGREGVFEFLTDPTCFYTPYGLTTADQKDPRFLYEVDHECLWNGYVWPFAIAQTLTALRNVVQKYPDGKKFAPMLFDLTKQYAEMHRRITPEGEILPWIDEVKSPLKEEWYSRETLKNWGWPEKFGGYERGKDYNHSTYCDLILAGVLGIRYDCDELVVEPCIPEEWEYFRVENLWFRGEKYTVLYDKTGEKYHCGQGVVIQKQ